MSIASELQNYATYLEDAYDKCQDKGATIPQNRNLQNLTNCIDTISGGGGGEFLENMPNVSNAFLYALVNQPQINFPSTNTTCQGLFANCYGLTSINLSQYNTSNVTRMDSMFSQCLSATSITFGGLFDTSKVTNMSNMFSVCRAVTSLDVSSFDTSKVTNMGSMFALNNSINYNTNVTHCTSITFGNNFDTSIVTNMQGMFQCCDALLSLDLSGFSAVKVTSMRNMFVCCNKLTTLDVSYLATNVNTSIYGTFQYCHRLVTLKLGNFDCSKVTETTGVFNRCEALENIDGCLLNVGQAYTSTTVNYNSYRIALNTSNSLTTTSLLNIINGLYDLASAGKANQSLQIGSTNIAKLTSSEIAIATNKGWNVT